MEDPSAAMSDVSALIEQDPALAAKILSVSNSASYGLARPVASLKLAMVILGVQEVQNIVLGVSMFDALRDDKTEYLLAREHVRHSVMVGALAKRLGSCLRLNLDGEDFVSGLLHDIGKMLLCRQFSKKYIEVYQAAGGTSGPLAAVEFHVFGFDHAQAGAALAMEWNLPKSLVDSLWFHHPRPEESLDDAEDAKLAALVRVANLAAHEDFSVEEDPSCAVCADSDAWAVLDTAPKSIPPGVRFQTLAKFTAGLENSPMPVF